MEESSDLATLILTKKYAREIEFPAAAAMCRGEHSVPNLKSVLPPSSPLRPPPTSSWISAVESRDQAASISSTVLPEQAASNKHPNFPEIKQIQVCHASELLQFERKKLVQSKSRTITEDDLPGGTSISLNPRLQSFRNFRGFI